MPVFWLIKKAQLTSDAKSGIGIIKNVLNVLLDIFSRMEPVFQLIICAKHSINLELAQHATRDIYYKTVNATILN